MALRRFVEDVASALDQILHLRLLIRKVLLRCHDCDERRRLVDNRIDQHTLHRVFFPQA